MAAKGYNSTIMALDSVPITKSSIGELANFPFFKTHKFTTLKPTSLMCSRIETSSDFLIKSILSSFSNSTICLEVNSA
jgi:hypothetical protein